jgi:hypothetical protein
VILTVKPVRRKKTFIRWMTEVGHKEINMSDYHKIFSGRFFFTVMTALVFAYSTYTKMLTNEQIYGIVTLVLAFYFSKKEETK